MASMPHPLAGSRVAGAKTASAIPARRDSRTSCCDSDASFLCVACGHDRAGSNPVVAAKPPAQPFALWRCDDCGLVQQHPRWTRSRIAALYEDDASATADPEEYVWSRAVRQYLVHLARFEPSIVATAHVAPAISRCNSDSPKALHGPRLLIVGCATGQLAVLAKHRGWRVTGLDHSAAAVSRAAVRFDLDVRAGSLSSHAATLAPFDLVLLDGALAEASDPVRLLNDVRKVLAPGGTLCIDAPNWVARRGSSNRPGPHRSAINYFDADCLARLLDACGFREIALAGFTPHCVDTLRSRSKAANWLYSLPSTLVRTIRRWLGNCRPTNLKLPRHALPPADMNEALRMVREVGCGELSTVQSQPTAECLVLTARR